MKTVGQRAIPAIAARPSAANLHRAAIHQAAGRGLAPQATTGIAKGVYRFRSQEEMNRATEEALARAVALNARARRIR